MEELYFIMERLLDLEYKQEAFIQILRAAEMSYGFSEDQKNMRMLASSSRWQMEDNRRDLRQLVSKLDEYIARNAVFVRNDRKIE